MRPVNLLPERYRPARATGRLRGSAYFTIAVLGVLLLMVLGYVLTSNSIKNTREETNDAIGQAQEAEARASALGSFGNFQQIKVQREAAVKSLATTRFDYERLMREMALVLPKDVYVSTFTATATGEAVPGVVATTGPTLTLGGCAPDHPSVADTLVRLRQLHNVIDVDLNTSAATEGGQCKVEWNVTATFNAETATEKRPSVPARLGGGS